MRREEKKKRGREDKSQVRPLRRKLLRARILVPLAVVLAAVLWYWHPWQPRIIIHERINPKDDATMVWVPAGKFRMGTGMGHWFRDDYRFGGLRAILDSADSFFRKDGGFQPAHTVYLDGYWIYQHEVTVAQYRLFCRATGRAMPAKPSWGWQDNYPIVNVNWNDAVAYAAWVGALLPTEAQWEKAARGPAGWSYPWGNAWDDTKCSNSVGPKVKSPSPVGSYPAGASPYGALDMAGNVFEWCADWYDEVFYWHTPGQNPVGPAKGDYRVLRGGAWDVDDSTYFRCADRGWYPPVETEEYFGFRCVVLP